jgi:hypothetical protein
MRNPFGVILIGILLACCSTPESPEQQVRKVIEQLELAAEARDTGGVVDHISPEYLDAHGQSREELARSVRGYFIANQSIHLLSRVEQLDFIADDEARAIVQVGMAAREAESSGDWSLAADVYEFDVTLRRGGDGWKIIHAEWTSD